MSDDEDYMSDKFLEATKHYTPPSLIHRHADKRELELLKKKAEIDAKLKERNKSVRVIEEEKREEGLSSAIKSDNKGFEMLMKMGYKPGQGIGKTESGISEPIGVDVKSNRLGLGKNIIKKHAKTKNPNAKLDSLNTNDFRGRIAQRKSEQLTEADVRKSQKVCQQLDQQSNVKQPNESWFWPPTEESKEDDEKSESSEEEDEEEVLSTKEKLEILTEYLRNKYFYCIWCGTTFENEEDLRDSCPGNTRDDH